MELDEDLDIADLDTRGALVRAGDLRRIRDRAERDIFLLAAHYADLHNPDVRGPGDDGLLLRGGERPVQVGAVGTPRVREFAFALLGAELAITSFNARRLIEDALNTRHRLPRIWARVVAGEVPVWIARKVAVATTELTVDQAGQVDANTVEYADGRLPYARFAEKLEAEVIRADPDAAARREAEAAKERFAKVGQSNNHGQKTLYVKISAAEMTRIDATIKYLADALATLGDPDTIDLRRAKAMLLLANPVQALALMQALATHNASNGSGLGPQWADDEPLPENEPPPPPDPADDSAAALDAPGNADSGPSTPTASMPGAAPSTTSTSSDEAGSGVSPHDEGTPPDTPPEPAPPDETPDGPPEHPPGTPPHTHPPSTESPDLVSATETGREAAAEAARLRLAKFYEPFRPTDVPACPCRGGHWSMDWAKLLPQVTLYLHVHADTIDRGEGGVVRWEGEGPISAQYVQEFLGPQARFVIKPVIDLAGLAPVDAYEVPERHREALHLRTPADVFPYAPNTGRAKQVDHTRPYRVGEKAQTALDNLGGMTTYHHRVKTHGGWKVEQPIPGIYLWQSPYGSVFLVDHSGTRQLRRPQAS